MAIFKITAGGTSLAVRLIVRKNIVNIYVYHDNVKLPEQ